MATIYLYCQEVLVWLGNCYVNKTHSIRCFIRNEGNNGLLRDYAEDFGRDAAELDYCFHLVCFFFLLKDVSGRVDFNTYELPPFWGTGSNDRLARYDIPNATEEFKECYKERICFTLKHLSETTWPTRLWTLQEYAVAPKVTICFGTAGLPLEVFMSALPNQFETRLDADDLDEVSWKTVFSRLMSSVLYKFFLHHTLRNIGGTFRPFGSSGREGRIAGPLTFITKTAQFWITRTLFGGLKTLSLNIVLGIRIKRPRSRMTKFLLSCRSCHSSVSNSPGKLIIQCRCRNYTSQFAATIP